MVFRCFFPKFFPVSSYLSLRDPGFLFVLCLRVCPEHESSKVIALLGIALMSSFSWTCIEFVGVGGDQIYLSTRGGSKWWSPILMILET